MADQEINTGGGSAIQGDAKTGGGAFVGRDQAENTQRNNVNIILENRDRLEIIDYKLTRLNDNFEFSLARLEYQLENRLLNVERDIQQMRRDIDQTKTDGAKTRNDVDELKQQSILVKFAPSTQPVAPNGTLRRLFWILVGFGFILTILLSVLIVLLARNFR